ncbi:hypothetical protein SCHPADRAFT_900708 [Schizopora paradoxa]|uniref:Uncharacterized protein n=1 Tax=Schizopora paradoxa TaxID=27342 RepID=A0A0H2S739_9AGAM|nr:hypothetical protein SCHPADRAFT_900708 [Schizopora paradoxa]
MVSTVNTAKLPVLLPRPHPHQPIRAIDADAFADLHLAHFTTDVPDSVLFPFLHGLEGDNYQQNSFFAASSGLNVGGNGAGARAEYGGGGRASNVVKVPRYRGLVWVACDEDGQERLLAQGQADDFSHPEDIDLEDADGDFDFGYDSVQSTSHQSHFQDASGDAMQVDHDAPAPHEHEQLSDYDAAHVSEDTVDATEDANEAPHMHPLALRKVNASPPISISTGAHPSHSSFSHPHGVRAASAPTSLESMSNANPQDHPRNPDARRLSTASSDSASSSSSSSRSTSASSSRYNFELGTSGSYSTTASSVEDKDALFDGETGNDSPTTPCTSPLTDICFDDCIPNAPAESANNARESGSEHAFPDVDASRLTITSSFKPDDLLTVDPMDRSPMFVDPRVPDGISLRNFGIQTPIYATLSDIVIYSPNSSDGGAGPSRSAFALAQNFKLAIEKKAAERKKRYEDAGVEVVWIRDGPLGEACGGIDKDLNFDDDTWEEKYLDADETDAGTPKQQSSNRPKAHLVAYNVYVLTDPLPVLARKAPWLLSRLPPPGALSPEDPLCSDDFDFLDRDRAFTSGGPLMGGVEVVSSGYGSASRSATSSATPSGALAPTTSNGSANPADLGASLINALPDEIMPAVDFAAREREEMRELTRSSPILGDVVYLGNANDVPLPAPRAPRVHTLSRKQMRDSDMADLDHKAMDDDSSSGDSDADSDDNDWDDGYEEDPFDSSDNPDGYDVCIECRDCAPIPNVEQLRQAEAHLSALDAAWNDRRKALSKAKGKDKVIEEEASPSPAGMPSSPSSMRTVTSPPGSPSSCRRSSVSPSSRRAARPPPSASNVVHLTFPASPPAFVYSIWALQPFLSFISSIVSPRQQPPSSRPKRVLLYSSDGYTESSVLALCVLMKECGLDLPGAYLELQVEKGRSFFVYQSDLGTLKRIESHLKKERENTRPFQPPYRVRSSQTPLSPSRPSISRNNSRDWTTWTSSNAQEESVRETGASHPYARSPRNSISYPASALEAGLPPMSESAPAATVPHRRPRAQTSPLLPPHIDHQTWFTDPRFDGSFPSRVLPFLYLGNLNHAQNAYMLHALGITHVVSVGECALVPPPNIATSDSSSGYHLVAGRGPGGHGSLWMEEREGRIKVLDIKGVCDDGIDSLQHQLGPVCDWMERAREEGGKILVHCRVGVSRSATVTIAYVMKHLAMSLVDAYLIVRSRRLNVLIQPNMRLLYNLCGWEVELARERAKGDTTVLRRELSRSVNWPFLAREVHRLNEKYLH